MTNALNINSCSMAGEEPPRTVILLSFDEDYMLHSFPSQRDSLVRLDVSENDIEG